MLSLCKHPVMAASVELRRAFALIGLLRLADANTVPLDLLYLYLAYTDTCGLRYNLFSNFAGTTDNGQGDGSDTSYRAHLTIPKGLSKMASRYLDRCCRIHINHILQLTSGGCTYSVGPIMANRPQLTVKLFPAYVGEALDRLTIPDKATLREVKHVVDALYGAICPVNLPEHQTFATNMFPLTDRQRRSLHQLKQFVFDVLRGPTLDIDVYTRNTFCNLLELLLVIDYNCSSYVDALTAKQVYDYNRTFASECGTLLPRSEIWPRTKGANVMKPICGKLSPHAALCVGAGVVIPEQDSCTAFASMHVDLLSELFTNILEQEKYESREVALYFDEEIEVETHYLNNYLSGRNN